MTEKNDNKDNTVPIGRFLAALICAPLMVTAATFWMFVPIYALLLGGPFFVLIGAPILWFYLRRNPPAYVPIMLRAALVQPVVFAALGLFAWAMDNHSMLRALPMFFLFACIFAAIWAAAFVALYRPRIRNV